MEEHQAKVKRKVNVSAMDEPSSEPKLPLEIIEEILSRLPAESLSNNRSVCKSWNCLIADPRFVKKHLGRSKGPTHLRILINSNSQELILRSYSVDSILSQRSCLAWESLRFPSSRQIRNFGFVGSCNGLVCFMVDYATLVEIYICNFSTRECRKFPSKFSSSINGNIFGFGYDSETNDYKLLRMNYFRTGLVRTITIDIFSLATCSTKRIQDFPYERRINEDGSLNSVFLNGSFHWTARHAQGRTIVALDLATETYKEIPQPELLDESNPRLTELDALGDRLLLLCNYRRRRYHDVWMMKEYRVKESWTKLVRIMRWQVATPIVVLPKLLSISDDGESILMMRELSLVMYSTKENMFHTLPSPNFTDQEVNGYRLRASLGLTTISSLVSPYLIMRKNERTWDWE